MPQSRHPRAWVKDQRICKNCGHTRARHGGNIGKGRFGSRVFCVEAVRVEPDRALSFSQACGCRTFEPEE